MTGADQPSTRPEVTHSARVTPSVTPTFIIRALIIRLSPGGGKKTTNSKLERLVSADEPVVTAESLAEVHPLAAQHQINAVDY